MRISAVDCARELFGASECAFGNGCRDSLGSRPLLIGDCRIVLCGEKPRGGLHEGVVAWIAIRFA